VTIEDRAADGHYDRLPALAAELVNLRPAVIVANYLPATLAAKSATGANARLVFWISEDIKQCSQGECKLNSDTKSAVENDPNRLGQQYRRTKYVLSASGAQLASAPVRTGRRYSFSWMPPC
jgi:hypothetical protein